LVPVRSAPVVGKLEVRRPFTMRGASPTRGIGDQPGTCARTGDVKLTEATHARSRRRRGRGLEE
jgi:hypothetical protein